MTFFWLLLVLVTEVRGQFISDSGLPMPPLSQRTHKLLIRAEDGGRTSIHFDTYAIGPKSEYQGITLCDDAVKSCTIRIGLGFSPAHEDSIVAHEVEHVILDQEGFPRKYSLLRLVESNTVIAHWDHQIALELINCVADPEDDRRLASLGYPIELQIKQLQKARLEDAQAYVDRPDDSRGFISLGLGDYCSRLRGADMSTYLAIMSKKAPQEVEVEERLWRRFGRRTCRSPNTCRAVIDEIGKEVIPNYQGHPEIVFDRY